MKPVAEKWKLGERASSEGDSSVLGGPAKFEMTVDIRLETSRRQWVYRETSGVEIDSWGSAVDKQNLKP